MQQLTGLDTSFLAMESPTTYGHVSGLMVLDPSGLAEPFSAQQVRDVLEARLHLLGPFRWRLVEVPFGVDRPYWANDPAFDLDFHVREIALARPGSDAQLAAQVARIHSRPLDRSRPLWELYLIEGLESGHAALLSKIHHAVIDGMSGAEIMGLLLDLSPEGRELPDAPAAAGARMDAHYPVSVITDGMGLNITVMSYLDHLDVGIVADRDQMPDVDRLIGWLHNELAALG